MNISRQAFSQRSQWSAILEKGEDQWLWARKYVMRDTTLAEWRKGETNLTSKQWPDETERDWSPSQCGQLSTCNMFIKHSLVSLVNSSVFGKSLLSQISWFNIPALKFDMTRLVLRWFGWSLLVCRTEIFPPPLQMSFNTNHCHH